MSWSGAWNELWTSTVRTVRTPSDEHRSAEPSVAGALRILELPAGNVPALAVVRAQYRVVAHRQHQALHAAHGDAERARAVDDVRALTDALELLERCLLPL